MVIALLLSACTDPPIPDVIRGLQIVAIESSPADPGPFDLLNLKIWVADGQGLGADVLVWVCTPVSDPEGGGVRCAEAYPSGSTGLPLSIFTRVGRVDRRTGPAYFESSNPWPIFVSIADAQYVLPRGLRGKMIVGALACAPGVCPIVDQVSIDPLSDSDAWHQAEGTLADLAVRGARSFLLGEDADFLPPEQSDLSQDRAAWLYELPPGQVSLAAKFVPVYLPDLVIDIEDDTTTYGGTRTDTAEPENRPNHAPSLALASVIKPRDRVARLAVSDPDGDPLKIRTFVTAGGVSSARDTGLEILWHPPVDPLRPADLFVVAEDGRGGTAVWQWGAEESACPEGPLVPSLGSISDPLLPGDPLPLTTEDGLGNGTQYGVRIPWYITGPRDEIEASLTISTASSRLARVSLGVVETDHNLGACRSSWGPTWVSLSESRRDACALAGSPIEVLLTIDVPADPEFREIEARVQGVLTAGDAGCELP